MLLPRLRAAGRIRLARASLQRTGRPGRASSSLCDRALRQGGSVSTYCCHPAAFPASQRGCEARAPRASGRACALEATAAPRRAHCHRRGRLARLRGVPPGHCQLREPSLLSARSRGATPRAPRPRRRWAGLAPSAWRSMLHSQSPPATGTGSPCSENVKDQRCSTALSASACQQRPAASVGGRCSGARRNAPVGRRRRRQVPPESEPLSSKWCRRPAPRAAAPPPPGCSARPAPQGTPASRCATVAASRAPALCLLAGAGTHSSTESRALREHPIARVRTTAQGPGHEARRSREAQTTSKLRARGETETFTDQGRGASSAGGASRADSAYRVLSPFPELELSWTDIHAGISSAFPQLTR